MVLRRFLVGISLSIVVSYGLYIVLGGIDRLSYTFGVVDRQDAFLPGGTHDASSVTTLPAQSPTPFQRHHHQDQDQKSILLAQLESSRPAVSSRKGPRYRLLRALYGFRKYEEMNFEEVERLERLYDKIPTAQRKVVESTLNYTSNFSKAKELFSLNKYLADDMVKQALEYYQIDEDELMSFIKGVESDSHHVLPPDRTSVSQALKHVVRDWSVDGQHERLATYPCILETLEMLCSGPLDRAKGTPIKVLLPGAGLNRLAHEISSLEALQIEVTTNEFSSYMNVVYQYLLTLRAPSSLYFHPYPDNWSHQTTLTELHRGVHAPDVLLSRADVTLAEGDFSQVFKAPEWSGSQDVLVTHFFIDTARNLLSYVETIHRLLKPGGFWINMGPLLWSHNSQLQLSLDEVVKLSEAVGFVFVESDERWGEKTLPHLTVRSVHAPYGFNHRTLSQNAYKAQFWVARKQRTM